MSASLEPGDTIGGHPDPMMRRVERVIVSGLRDEFGPGQQRQVTMSRFFEIAVGGVIVTVRRDPDSYER